MDVTNASRCLQMGTKEEIDFFFFYKLLIHKFGFFFCCAFSINFSFIRILWPAAHVSVHLADITTYDKKLYSIIILKNEKQLFIVYWETDVVTIKMFMFRFDFSFLIIYHYNQMFQWLLKCVFNTLHTSHCIQCIVWHVKKEKNIQRQYWKTFIVF